MSDRKRRELRKQMGFSLSLPLKKKLVILSFLLIIILVLGFIFSKQIKKFISNPPKYESTAEMSKEEILEHYEEHKEKIENNEKEERLKALRRKNNPKLKGRALKDRHPFVKNSRAHFIGTDNLKLIDLPSGFKSRIQEVGNLIAIDSKLSDEINPEDIIDERLGKVFVPKEVANDYVSKSLQNRVSYNLRTKRLGIITGKLLINFNSDQAFKDRREAYQSLGNDFANEVASFEVTKFAIINLKGSQSLAELLSLEKSLGQRPGIKRVRTEIIEIGKSAR